MFRYDDKDLDELEDRANGIDHVERLRQQSATTAETLRIQQNVDPRALDSIRDLLLAGKDIDAIAMLANELDMVPLGQQPKVEIPTELGRALTDWGTSVTRGGKRLLTPEEANLCRMIIRLRNDGALK